MLIKVFTEIVIDVEDKDQAQSACITIENGLLNQMRGFPDGDPQDVTVDHFEQMTDEQIKAMGLEEY